MTIGSDKRGSVNFRRRQRRPPRPSTPTTRPWSARSESDRHGRSARRQRQVLPPTCYCPRREHGYRRETAAAPPDAGPHRQHAARRQRHPGGDRQRLHDRESRDRGDPSARSTTKWSVRPSSSASIRTTPLTSPGGGSRRRSRRNAGYRGLGSNGTESTVSDRRQRGF